MDLSPFAAIDPCGYPGLAVTDLATLGVSDTASAAGERIANRLVRLFDAHEHEPG